MGCCSSQCEDVKITAPPVIELTKTAPLVKDVQASDANTGGLSSGEIKLKIIIPEDKRLSGNYTASPTDANSPSPTAVSQRSRKSVTFNPISTIKEYNRDSSSMDKNFTTYLISQLGEFDWSDDESDGMDEERDSGEDGSGYDDGDEGGDYYYYDERGGEYQYGFHKDHQGDDHVQDDAVEDPEVARLTGMTSPSEHPSLRHTDSPMVADDGSNEIAAWQAGTLSPSEEVRILEGHPDYIEGFDFDYSEHLYGTEGEEQGAYMARFSPGPGRGLHSYTHPSAGIWVASN